LHRRACRSSRRRSELFLGRATGRFIVERPATNLDAEAFTLKFEQSQTVIGDQSDQLAQLIHIHRLLEVSWRLIPMAPAAAIAWPTITRPSLRISFRPRRHDLRLFGFLIGHCSLNSG
jgi:hypothetical protein